MRTNLFVLALSFLLACSQDRDELPDGSTADGSTADGSTADAGPSDGGRADADTVADAGYDANMPEDAGVADTFPPDCGNGVIEWGEGCDGTDSVSCNDLGLYGTGEVTCHRDVCWVDGAEAIAHCDSCSQDLCRARGGCCSNGMDGSGLCHYGLPTNQWYVCGRSCATCELGTYCQETDDGFDGECAAVREAGASCEVDWQCASSACLDGTCATCTPLGKSCSRSTTGCCAPTMPDEPALDCDAMNIICCYPSGSIPPEGDCLACCSSECEGTIENRCR